MTGQPDTAQTTLSKRGVGRSGPANRLTLLDILHNQYDPSTNPNGYVSLGVAENVSLPSLTH